MDFPLSIITALWLGILCSISPCPLATNVAAISFVSYRVAHQRIVLLSGILYTLGRSVIYIVISFLIIHALVNIPVLSDFLQQYINKIVGILLIAVGLFLLDLWKINLPSISISEALQKRLDEIGIVGSFFLGALFALAFCPVSAALFFGSLIPLAIMEQSTFGFPLTFGIGTSLPVLIFAVVIAFGSRYADEIYCGLKRVEYFAKRGTGVVFILIGIYYVLTHIFNIL
jgi:cytochrome c biogenesis protein CcdA